MIDWIELRKFDVSAIPFALDVTGQWKEVDEVLRGKACGCICPACSGPVVARHGDVRVHHFAHHDRKDCRLALETSLFGMAVEILRMGELQLPGGGVRSEILTSMGYTRGPLASMGEPWLISPRKVKTDEAIVNCSSLGESRPDVPDIVLPAEGIEIHLVSMRKPAHRIEVKGTPERSVLGIDLRTYARIWWETCDSEKEEKIRAAKKARGLMQDWLGNELTGRGWFYNHALEAKKQQLVVAVQEAKQQELAQREAERLRWQKFQDALKRPRDAVRSGGTPNALSRPAGLEDLEWQIPAKLEGVSSTGWVATSAGLVPKPLRVMREVLPPVSQRHAANLGFYWHPIAGKWYFVGAAPDFVPLAIRALIVQSAPWKAVTLEDEKVLRGAQVGLAE